MSTMLPGDGPSGLNDGDGDWHKFLFLLVMGLLLFLLCGFAFVAGAAIQVVGR